MPHKPSAKAGPPELDYSRRSLLDKLGVKPGQRTAVLGLSDAAVLKILRSASPISLVKNRPAAPTGSSRPPKTRRRWRG
jgi:hypothetical protein